MRTGHRWILLVLGLFGAIVGGTRAAYAQSTSATVQGVVRDNQGAVLPGVIVTITNAETGLARDVVSADAGFYRIAALPPGTYTIGAALEGFAAYNRAGLLLTVGQTATIDIPLALAGVTEAVTISADTPLIDTTSNALGTTVTNAQLDDLPLAGRDFATLARLAPGVTGVGGGGISAGGQLTRNNSIVVDGASNDEQGIASTRGSFSLESVREYVIYTNQFAAEHGLATGALVNVVTRSGTNNLEGRLFAFHRDDSLDARNPFSKAQGSGNAPFSEQRAGGFLGGPIVRNTWHYFGSYEGQRNETTNVVTSPLVPVERSRIPREQLARSVFLQERLRAAAQSPALRTVALRPQQGDGPGHRRTESARARQRSEDEVSGRPGVADVDRCRRAR